ncbi:serine proteinase inhibitor [Ancylostoma duodenale]|uniref:Serine proteinase inhibitor n=1 Tax=Ancylostoma duodenale TaxID=51022 RepID=A0A0C2H238_9BILA|nr:serine proteinase inhibitor [Ancylostoma duodenale]
MDLGLNMLRLSPKNEAQVVSPLSVIFALALVQAGAKGGTRSQINEVISKGATDDEFVDFYSNLANSTLSPSSGVQTRIANAFFLNGKYSIDEQYNDTITEKYSSKVEALDFGQIKHSTEIINEFVSMTTEGKIKDFIPEDIVSAKWEEDSADGSIIDRTFRSIENVQKEMEFLNERDESRYNTEDEEMEVLSLRYKDTSSAFNIILPKKMFGLDELSANLTRDTDKPEPTISIPKMTVETDFDLKEALIAMGIEDMFSASADLTGIAESPPLAFSDATHKAIVEVDEGRIAAAAVTILR